MRIAAVGNAKVDDDGLIGPLQTLVTHEEKSFIFTMVEMRNRYGTAEKSAVIVQGKLGHCRGEGISRVQRGHLIIFIETPPW